MGRWHRYRCHPYGLLKRGTSKSHQVAEEFYANWNLNDKKPEFKVSSQIDRSNLIYARQREDQISRNRYVLRSILYGILYLGRNGLALRGHRENKSDPDSRGNMLGLMKLISKHDVIIKNHIEKGAANAQYISASVQHEFILLIAKHIRAKVLESIKNAKEFCLLVDEASDVSKKEWASFFSDL